MRVYFHHGYAVEENTSTGFEHYKKAPKVGYVDALSCGRRQKYWIVRFRTAANLKLNLRLVKAQLSEISPYFLILHKIHIDHKMVDQ